MVPVPIFDGLSKRCNFGYIINNRLKCLTMIMYIRAENMYMDVHGSKMQQPSNLFSTTFQKLGLIPS